MWEGGGLARHPRRDAASSPPVSIPKVLPLAELAQYVLLMHDISHARASIPIQGRQPGAKARPLSRPGRSSVVFAEDGSGDAAPARVRGN